MDNPLHRGYWFKLTSIAKKNKRMIREQQKKNETKIGKVKVYEKVALAKYCVYNKIQPEILHKKLQKK